MKALPKSLRERPLEWLVFALLIAYSFASLLHFSHNAIYLERYPNMPAWITRSGVMAAWGVVAAVGLCGLVLLRYVNRLAGLIVLSVYAALGFDGLAHYCLAPISMHGFDINFTIWAEVVAATALLGSLMMCAPRRGNAFSVRR
ncbi:MAG TPA: hypothetical protein VJU83_00075 [Burkholderiales bacterium]|nr:hypothetical protein [Burkholderiales bacterium]